MPEVAKNPAGYVSICTNSYYTQLSGTLNKQQRMVQIVRDKRKTQARRNIH